MSHCKIGPQHTMTNHYRCVVWLHKQNFPEMASESFYLLPISENRGSCPSVELTEILLWCGAHLKTYPGDNSFMQEQTVSLVCYLHISSSWTLTFHLFYTIYLHFLSQAEGFLLNNRTYNDTIRHNWIIKLSAPALFPRLYPCQQWLAVETSACKPVHYRAGFCKSAKGKGRREKGVNLCVALVPI